MTNDNQAVPVAPTANNWRTRFMRFALVRIIVALLVIGVPAVLASMALDKLLSADSATPKTLLNMGIFVALYWAYVRVIEKRLVSEMAMTGFVKEMGLGLVVGVLLFSSTIGILALVGAYQVTGVNHWTVMLAIPLMLVTAGLVEEIIFRAVIFRLLENALGSWPALAISALLFGLVHLLNPNATFLAGMAIAIEAGVMLGAAYMLTRRIWLCTGIHIAWNFAQGGIFSVAVSGTAFDGLIQATMTGPDWLTGGSFGAEASLVAVMTCVALGAYFIFAAQKKGHVVPAFWQRKAAVNTPLAATNPV